VIGTAHGEGTVGVLGLLALVPCMTGVFQGGRAAKGRRRMTHTTPHHTTPHHSQLDVSTGIRLPTHCYQCLLLIVLSALSDRLSGCVSHLFSGTGWGMYTPHFIKPKAPATRELSLDHH
jgi:hypothetical protein